MTLNFNDVSEDEFEEKGFLRSRNPDQNPSVLRQGTFGILGTHINVSDSSGAESKGRVDALRYQFADSETIAYALVQAGGDMHEVLLK